MRRKLRRHFAFLMAVLMMLSLMGVQVLAEGVQVEAVQTTEGTDCTVLPEETDAEETSRSEMQKPGAKESPPESGVVTEEGKSTDSEKISVVLKDEILTKGSLTAEVSGTTESDQIAYQWQVSEKGQWKDIEDTATVDSRKQSYEVARDGAQKTFRVKVTVNEAVTVYSSEYKVNYYDKLQNGSFETPKVSDAGTLTYTDAHFIQVANGTNNLYWKTTAKGAYFGAGNQKDYYIEIADGSRSYYGNTVNDPKPVYNISSAAQENQFAELNCEEPGALYQDVLTEPGRRRGSVLLFFVEKGKRKNRQNPKRVVVILLILTERVYISGRVYGGCSAGVVPRGLRGAVREARYSPSRGPDDDRPRQPQDHQRHLWLRLG